MPDLDGLELLERIRADSETDVMIMTGHSGDVTFEEIIEKGALDFVHKPIQTRELQEARERNGFWLGSLELLGLRDRPLSEVLDRQERIDALTREELHRGIGEHLALEPYTWVSWVPALAAAETGS